MPQPMKPQPDWSKDPREEPKIRLRLDTVCAPTGKLWLRDVDSGRIVEGVSDVRIEQDSGFMRMIVTIECFP